MMDFLICCTLRVSKLLALETSIQNKKGCVISLHRSPSQSKDEFNQFPLNFEQLISDRINQNLHFILETSDFNVRSSSWWGNDLTAREDCQFNAITSSYGSNQLIHKPARILPNSSSCIDLIFIH